MKDNLKCSDMEKAYQSFLSVIEENQMRERILQGVLVGFSGGPDSVLLLHFLLRYRREISFPLIAVHVHHGIRGESADRDASFAEATCAALGVECLVVHVDVPSAAKISGNGIEETARKLRYSAFYDIIQSRNDIITIALGHNATDNLETVIFHLMRGCGSLGLSGIAPVRDNIIRPLISISKAEVLAALSEENIAYVIDETNGDIAYTRNYIRKEIFPKLARLSAHPEVSVARVCRNLICDNDFLEKEADRWYARIAHDRIERSMLASLHPAIFARVMLRWGRMFDSELASVHVEKMYALLQKSAPFSVDLPFGLHFFADTDKCYLEKQTEQNDSIETFFRKILPEQPALLMRGAFLISRSECQNISPNIYNFSIKARLSSAIIEGELFVRYRQAGDRYYYGGMTHKLKKLFNDKKMPLKERETLPILCDSKGIVWVPGFGVRDDGGCDANAMNAAFFF